MTDFYKILIMIEFRNSHSGVISRLHPKIFRHNEGMTDEIFLSSSKGLSFRRRRRRNLLKFGEISPRKLVEMTVECDFLTKLIINHLLKSVIGSGYPKFFGHDE